MSGTFPAYSDHSWGRPGAQAIKDAGYLGVMRYLGDPSNGRNLGQAEMDSYHDVGLLVGYIWESGASRVLDGYNAGRDDANSANYWMDQLGVPSDVPVIGTTVDFDANADQLRGPIADYARGFEDASKRPQQPYGSDRTLDILCGELGLFPCGWQTRAWSGGRVSKYACMMQEVGYVLGDTSDHNSILNLEQAQDLGWNPTIAPEQPKPQEDEPMLTIWWSEPNDPWVRDIAAPFLLKMQGETIDPAHAQGFRVEGPVCKYIGVHAYEGHEGWDARTTAVRGILAMMGFPNGEREAGGIKWDLWQSLCLMAHTTEASVTVNVDGDATDIEAVVDEIVKRTSEATINELHERTAP